MRILKQDLESLANRINQATVSPLTPYSYGKANEGCYYIDYAYGGVELCRVINDKGGVREVSPFGHTSNKELFIYMSGMLEGLERNN